MKVLVIENEPDELAEYMAAIRSARALDGSEYEVSGEADYRIALERIKKEYFDIVVTDMRMGATDEEGLDVIGLLSRRSAVAIVLTGYANIPNCAKAMRAGAWDYIEKNPEDGTDPYERLLASLERACKERLANPERGKTNPDLLWIRDHLGELAKSQRGRVIAVLFERVVDSDTDYSALLERVQKAFPLAKPTILSIPEEEAGEMT